jgi:type III secretory pathway component EscR
MESTIEERRELARRWRIQEQRAFKINLVIYLGVNAMLVVIWTVLTVAGVRMIVQPLPQGFFYPIIPIVVWGIFVAINGYTAYRGHSYSEVQIEREMKHLPG